MTKLLYTWIICIFATLYAAPSDAKDYESHEAYYAQRLQKRYATRFVFGGGIQSATNGKLDGYASIGDVTDRKFFLVRLGDPLPSAPHFRLTEIHRQHVVIEGRHLRLRVMMMYHISRPETRKGNRY